MQQYKRRTSISAGSRAAWFYRDSSRSRAITGRMGAKRRRIPNACLCGIKLPAKQNRRMAVKIGRTSRPRRVDQLSRGPEPGDRGGQSPAGPPAPRRSGPALLRWSVPRTERQRTGGGLGPRQSATANTPCYALIRRPTSSCWRIAGRGTALSWRPAHGCRRISPSGCRPARAFIWGIAAIALKSVWRNRTGQSRHSRSTRPSNYRPRWRCPCA